MKGGLSSAGLRMDDQQASTVQGKSVQSASGRDGTGASGASGGEMKGGLSGAGHSMSTDFQGSLGLGTSTATSTGADAGGSTYKEGASFINRLDAAINEKWAPGEEPWAKGKDSDSDSDDDSSANFGSSDKKEKKSCPPDCDCFDCCGQDEVEEDQYKKPTRRHGYNFPNKGRATYDDTIGEDLEVSVSPDGTRTIRSGDGFTGPGDIEGLEAALRAVIHGAPSGGLDDGLGIEGPDGFGDEMGGELGGELGDEMGGELGDDMMGDEEPGAPPPEGPENFETADEVPGDEGIESQLDDELNSDDGEFGGDSDLDDDDSDDGEFGGDSDDDSDSDDDDSDSDDGPPPADGEGEEAILGSNDKDKSSVKENKRRRRRRKRTR
jgi:hypothetical protein